MKRTLSTQKRNTIARIKVRKVCLFALILACLSSVFTPAVAAPPAQDVQITLPAFNVTFNGTKVDSLNREYPLIVYKGITYFPMTYYDCRYLGLQTKWTSQTGLEINSTGVSGLYRDYKRDSENARNYAASIVSTAVRLNGTLIDKSKEEYPLLLFRGLTYFPMTWRFCVDEFGWGYTFNAYDGLRITSTNPAATTINIPLPTEYNEMTVDSISLIVSGDSYYISDSDDGAIYKGSLANPAARRAVYQLTADSKHVWGYLPVDFTMNNNKVCLYYYSRAGGIAGAVRFNDDGTWEEILPGWEYYGDVSIGVEYGYSPEANNLYIRRGAADPARVGDPGYIYGWKWKTSAYGDGGSTSDDLYLVNDDIYVLAFDKVKNNGTTGIYRVNTKTNATTRVVDAEVFTFVIENETIYYVDQADHRIYKVAIAGGAPTPMTAAYSEGSSVHFLSEINYLSDMQVLNGKVYYMTETYGPPPDNVSTYNLNRTGDNESINPGASVRGIQLIDGYIVATFNSADGSLYRLMVFNAAGDVVYKTSDQVILSTVTVDNDRLYYVDSETRLVGMVVLTTK